MNICDVNSVKSSDHKKNNPLNRHRSNPIDNGNGNQPTSNNLTGHSIIYGELVILG